MQNKGSNSQRSTKLIMVWARQKVFKAWLLYSTTSRAKWYQNLEAKYKNKAWTWNQNYRSLRGKIASVDWLKKSQSCFSVLKFSSIFQLYFIYFPNKKVNKPLIFKVCILINFWNQVQIISQKILQWIQI